jgi:predicted nuclease of predicted toxin-antitoxin system
MRLLLDECVPRKLKSIFEAKGYACDTVHDAGYSGKTNGELLALAENHFDVLVTVDQNIRHQQNMTGRKVAILILRSRSNDIDDIRPLLPAAIVALSRITPGQVVEVPSGQ